MRIDDWQSQGRGRYVQHGQAWTHKAALVHDGVEFVATEHRGTDYVVPVPIAVLRDLVRVWHEDRAMERERRADSGMPGDYDAEDGQAEVEEIFGPRRTRTLWRPVGAEELVLIDLLQWCAFPPRLPEQPIFYPVCSVAYASEIAQRWNAKDGKLGFVTEFEVDTRLLEQYEIHEVGGAARQEYWINAADLEAFNAAIVGQIRVVRAFGPDGR